jgi:hypothetical protein
MSEELLTKFEGTIKVISENEFGKFGISKGSVIEKAKSLMPESFDAKSNIDVLPVVFNLAVVNKFNANGDGIDSETAINAVKRFANKPINIEHKKNKIVGHILNASFSDKELDFKDNDVQSFSKRKDPYYITAAGLIYKNIYPELANAIIQASDKENKEYQSISTSWELAFKDYKIAYGASDRLQDSKIIENESEAQEMKKHLKGFGGKGLDKDGQMVNRLIVGEVYPLGAALTTNPAANVSGVYLLQEDEEEDEREEEDGDDNQESVSNIELLNNSSKENKQKNSLINKNIVKIKKFKNILNMNDKQFDQFLEKLEQSIASISSEESQAKSISLIMRDALAEQADSWKSQVQQERESKQQIENDLLQLKASFEDAKKELDEIRAENAIKAAADLFNSRMNFLEDQYSFSEKEMQFVVAEVKQLEDSEDSFEQYKEKLSVLFAHKLKSTISSLEEEVRNRIEQEVTKRLETSSASKVEEKIVEEEQEEDLEVEESEANIPNNNGEISTKVSLIQKLKDSFSVEVKI